MGSFLYNLFIFPIEMIVEFVFFFFYKAFRNPGLSIAVVSVVINILALPLYNIANSLQKKDRDARQIMEKGIKRIKSAFKGDEQYMMLSTLYKQHNYHPVYALRSSVSLLIQVPFFIAAYRFLSNLELLQGESFSFISNLGSPDALLTIGGFSINLLPIVMTLINIVAGIIYMKGFPTKDKAQLYMMAGLFLILLYNSPSGLVLYWTLNNVFSLIKNLLSKLKKPLRIVYVVSVVGMLFVSVAFWNEFHDFNVAYLLILIVGNLFIILLPMIIKYVNIIMDKYLSPLSVDKKKRKTMFIFSGFLLFLIHGILIPTNLISSSVIDFSFTGNVDNPLSYVFHTATIFFGVWVIWALFIYALSNEKMKTLFTFVLHLLSISSLINLFIFTGDYGIINQFLQFDQPSLLRPSIIEIIGPVVLIVIYLYLFLLVCKKQKIQYLTIGLTIITLASFASGIISSISINMELEEYKKNIALIDEGYGHDKEIAPVFNLSREGKNVIYLFFDRAISGYFPVILEQFPELKQQFAGFDYYPNTVSYGINTYLGAPPMLGGYEYVPDEMNKRDSEKITDKHNEALLVLPKIFLDADYEVTIADAPTNVYADYSVFSPYPDINVLHNFGKYAMRYKQEFSDVLSFDEKAQSQLTLRRLPLFSIFKTAFPILREVLYEKSFYFTSLREDHMLNMFIDTYSELYYRSQLTEYTAEGNTYTFIANDTTHEPVLLQSPEYEPRTILTDISTPIDNKPHINIDDIEHYHINAATIKQVGKWLDQLRAEGVYDNTRIVIVSDHGNGLYSPHFEGFDTNSRYYTRFNPLLLVKDFDNNDDLAVHDKFMTQADAPLFAIKNLDVEQLNPFTKNDLLKAVNKDVVHVYSAPFNPRNFTPTTFEFFLDRSFSIKDSIFEESNWTTLAK